MKIKVNAQQTVVSPELQLAVQAIDAIDEPLVVLNHQGSIIFVNRAWEAVGRRSRLGDGSLPKRTSVGSNYLDVCRKAKGLCSEQAIEAVNGIEGVLEGRLRSFELLYPCHSATKQHWFNMKVKPVRRAKSRMAVIIHKEITDLHLSEMAVQAQRVELARLAERMHLAAGEMKALTGKSIGRIGSSNQPIGYVRDSPAQENDGASPLSVLSKREREVFSYIVQGQRNIQIAERLAISAKSIGTYRLRILEKLNMGNSAELIAFAARLGLA